jgi:hypothetical protein
MSSLSISAAWEETRSILVRDGQLYAAVALALVVLPEVVLAVVGAPVGAQASLLEKATYAAVILLGFVAQIALNRLAIGPSETVGAAIGKGFARLGSVLVVLVLLSILLVAVAVVLLLILSAARLVTLPAPGQAPPPSLILMLILLVALSFAVVQLAFPVAAVETANPLRIAARSWQLARGHYGRLLAFVAMIIFCFIVVVLATQFGVGSAVQLLLGPSKPGSLSALILGLAVGLIQAPFTVVTATMLARIYVQLTGRSEAQASVPNSGT